MGHAGPDRRDSLVPAHAIGVAWAARLGCRADAAVGDGMIVAASTALLADSRSGGRRDRRRRDHGTLDIHRGRLWPRIETAMAAAHTARTIDHTWSEDCPSAPGAGNVRPQRATCGIRLGAISTSTTAVPA